MFKNDNDFTIGATIADFANKKPLTESEYIKLIIDKSIKSIVDAQKEDELKHPEKYQTVPIAYLEKQEKTIKKLKEENEELKRKADSFDELEESFSEQALKNFLKKNDEIIEALKTLNTLKEVEEVKKQNCSIYKYNTLPSRVEAFNTSNFNYYY
ncbi:hypothetical protein PGN61_21040 [Klebsiella aerogenes]